MKFGKGEYGRQQTRKNKQRSGNASENEGIETTERRLKTNVRTVDSPTWGCARVGMVEAWVKRVKRLGNDEQVSEGESNDAIVAPLGRSVGGHPRVGGSESEDGSDSDSNKWSTSGER